MTTINGANNHNVDDILASIRTSIAEEGTSARSISGEIQMPSGRREALLAEEAADFELPAIFKPGHQAVPERQKLLGRLSDALKSSNPPEAARTRTVIPFEPGGARMAEHGGAQTMSHSAGDRANGRRPEPERAPPADGEVKRIMPTFFDTRVNKLGELTRQAYEPKPAPKPPEPAPPALPALRQQPMLPEGNLSNHGNGQVEDAVAQLLRPMLRQWLSENMPKIVEKALRSEIGMEFPSEPKKPGT